MLNTKDCQSIVNRVDNILDKNVNIINLQGVVIASSNPERIGTFHEGGRLCAGSGDEVIITKQNKHLYRGCKEGINFPIRYKNKIIGIVGITGDPDQIKPYGLLVKELVELIVKQNESRYTRDLHEQALRSFVLELIRGDTLQAEEVYIRRAQFLSVRDLRNKVVVVGSITNLADGLEESGEIKAQELRQKILDYIKNYYSKEEVIAFYLYDESFIMLLPYVEDKKENILELRERILKEFHVQVSFVISEECEHYSDYQKNYHKVDRAVMINKGRENKEDVILIENYDIRLLIDSIPNEDKEEYLEKYNKFFNHSKNKLMQELIETVKVYFENNMNIGTASEMLFVHRNTVGYRINKIKEEFDIDVTKSYECMQLYIAICLNEQPLHD